MIGLYIPNAQDVQNLVLNEIHQIPYVGNPGYQKTIASTRKQYFWPGMKKYVANNISMSIQCQQVKDEH